jgi:hypothetical protein
MQKGKTGNTKMTNTKKQHYVPQLYLRKFSKNKKTLWVFDKILQKSYVANIGDVAQQRYFYDMPKSFENLGVKDLQAIEKALAYGESIFQHAIEHVLANIEDGITEKLRLEICPHLTMQWLRTREYRDARIEFVQKMGQAFANRLIEKNYPEQPDIKAPICHATEEGAAVKQYQDMFDPEGLHKLNMAFLNHIWIIGVNNSGQPLYTSDNPVVRQAHIDATQEGGMGILSKGIEFLYPLSPQYILILRERSHFRSNETDENKTILLDNETIKRCNKLQIIQSSRQIFSPINKFDFAQKFCQKYPNLISGKRERFEVEMRGVPGKPLREYLIITERSEKLPP